MHRYHHHHHHSPEPHFFGGPRKGFGRGRFGGWFADGGELGGRGFGMGRKLASGDLQLLILELLAEKPRHGYEIIKALEERSKGFYVPSPGMVYPALTYLEEIGHATVETEGTRKRYRLTDLGRAYLEEHREETEALFGQLSRVGERLEHMRRIVRSAAGTDDESGEAGWSKALIRARHALRSAVAEKWSASIEEQERVADILKRAAQEIAAKEPRK
jgi:DNA-binding PadR family transcriptional regulator